MKGGGNRHMDFPSSMAEALRLVRTGRLGEATALLRSSFGTDRPAAPGREEEQPGTIIDIAPDHVAFAPRQPVEEAPFETDAAPRFEEHDYRGGGRVLTYRLYRPAREAPGMPLVVMLHGCTQSPEDFALGTGMNAIAEELGFLVAYPRQTQAANPQKCWNWFNPADQQRDGGEPALIAGATRAIIAAHAIDPGRVYVAGLSAGGAQAAIMASAYPDIYAAAGIHSGLACGVARDLPSALIAMKQGGKTRRTAASRAFVPVITFHGDRDTVVHEVNSREIVAAASAAAGSPLDVHRTEGRSPAGRRYARETSTDREGRVLIERWTIGGSGHAWSGGHPSASYTDPSGPDASREMARFFLAHGKG